MEEEKVRKLIDWNRLGCMLSWVMPVVIFWGVIIWLIFK